MIVYLEDTPLLKGMSLQLNSTQSLFRKNHPTNETFIRELLKARILQNCREGSDQNYVSQKNIEKNNENVTRISNVCSIGTNDENDLWPNGKYSQIINRDEFSVVFFHINLLKPFGFSGVINDKYQVYNSENNLIYEEESTMEIESSYDKISKGWILKGNDGSFVPSGEYRFVCSINNSPAFTYFFSISSDDETKPNSLPKRSFLGRIKMIFGN